LSTQTSTKDAQPTTSAVRAFQGPSLAEDPSRLESLAFCYGASYDSYLAVEPDRRVFWARTVPGAAAYVRAGRYVHIGGGLLAPERAKRQLLDEITCWADDEQLVLSFYNLTDDDLPLVRGAGFQVTKWGEEALVDLTACTWEGKAYEWLRRQTSFCCRQQIAVRECHRARMPAAEWDRIAKELNEISHAELGRKPQRDEIHFLEGHLDLAHFDRRRLFVAESHQGAGRIEGFLVCNPCLDGTRWAFETYRRRPDAVRGAMPFLMHQAMRQLQAEGVASVSLCLVPGLRCETPLPGDSPLARWSMVLASRHFSFIHDTRGMYHYKSRFRPRFANRYLAVRPRLSLGSAWSFVRLLGVLDLRFGNLLRLASHRLRSAASRRTLSVPATDGEGPSPFAARFGGQRRAAKVAKIIARSIHRPASTENIMAVEVKESEFGKILEIRATGKLAKQDYEHFVPVAERLIEKHKKIRVLFEMHDFHGWEAGALWEDVKFDVKHFRHIERLALVGESKWEKGMAHFCRPFTTAKIRYFDSKDVDEARTWIESD
jgi:phosphatidylglycerol lysyltransferase